MFESPVPAMEAAENRAAEQDAQRREVLRSQLSYNLPGRRR
jgi:hypothetical protein